MKKKNVFKLLSYILAVTMMVNATGVTTLAETFGEGVATSGIEAGTGAATEVATGAATEVATGAATEAAAGIGAATEATAGAGTEATTETATEAGTGAAKSTAAEGLDTETNLAAEDMEAGDAEGLDTETDIVAEELDAEDIEAEDLVAEDIDAENLDTEAIEDTEKIGTDTDAESVRNVKSSKTKVNDDGSITYSGIFVGEAFKNVITEEELKEYFENDSSKDASEEEIELQGGTYGSIAAVGTFLRTQMVNRVKDVSFTYAGSLGNFDSFMNSIINEAEKITGKSTPREGDYITSNTIGYDAGAYGYGSSWTVTISFKYTSTASQEKEVDTKVASIVHDLNLKSDTLTDGQKVKAIHDYLIDNVVYTSTDYIEPYTFHIHSSHAALCNGRAVCQGYAGAFYRLCAEAGIGCRYIVGVYDHAWNIVKLETERGIHWYNIDVTWDDPIPDGFKQYTFFLKNNTQFCKYDYSFNDDGHKREAAYNTAAFNKAYPMSDISLNTTTDLYPKLFVPASLVVQQGEVNKITARNNANASYNSISWESSNTGVLRLGKTETTIAATSSVSTGDTKEVFVQGQKKGNVRIDMSYSFKNAVTNQTLSADVPTINVQVVNYFFDREIGKLPKGYKEELTLWDDNEGTLAEGVVWKTSNAAIASVTNTNPCTVTARGVGKATITAVTKEGKAYETQITVIPVKKITGVAFSQNGKGINGTTLNRTQNDTAELVASIVPVDTSDLKYVKYEWSLSEEGIVKLENLDSEATGTGDGHLTSKVKLSTLSRSGYVDVICTATAAGVTKSSTCKVAVVSDVSSVNLCDSINHTDDYSKKEKALIIHLGETRRIDVNILPQDEKNMFIAGVTEESGSVSITDRVISDGYFEVKGSKVTDGAIPISLTVGGKSVEKDSVGSKTVTMYVAVWNNDITLHNYYGDVKIEAVPGEKISNLFTPPEVSGYRFVGWYTEDGGQGTLVDANTIFTNQYDLYTYYVKESDLSNLSIFTAGNVWSYEYKGAAVKPQVVVFDGPTKLVLNKDYTVSYVNNTNVYTLTEENDGFYDANGKTKAPGIVIKGKGNYSGTVTKYFVITPKAISDSDVVVDENALIKVANNKTQKVNPVLRYAGKPLAMNKDFSVSFPEEEAGAYTLPGVYKVKITGNGNFKGERIANIRILDAKAVKQVSKLRISLSKATLDYTGSSVRPTVTVKDGSILLTEGVDYTLTFDNDVAVGKAQVTVHGKGLYYVDSKSLTYTIKGRNIAAAKVLVNGSTAIPSMELTGNPLKQNNMKLQYKVGKDMVDLVENKDYKLVYTNNLLLGTATITIVGLGAYDGKTKKTFKITPYDIAVNRLGQNHGLKVENADSLTVEYAKAGANVKPVIIFNDGKLIEGVDYTLAYKNNKTVVAKDSVEDKLKPTVIIKGKGAFKGSISLFYTITAGPLEKCTITALDVKYADKANNWFSKVTVTDSQGKVLKENSDYTIEYRIDSKQEPLTKADKVDVNTVVKVTINPAQGKDGKYLYSGQLIGTYMVVPSNNNIAQATFKISDKTYTGTPIGVNTSNGTFTLTASDFTTASIKNGKDVVPLTLNTDYEIINITNNINKGNATVILRGKGKYCGTKKVTFRIKSKDFWSIFKIN